MKKILATLVVVSFSVVAHDIDYWGAEQLVAAQKGAVAKFQSSLDKKQLASLGVVELSVFRTEDTAAVSSVTHVIKNDGQEKILRTELYRTDKFVHEHEGEEGEEHEHAEEGEGEGGVPEVWGVNELMISAAFVPKAFDKKVASGFIEGSLGLAGIKVKLSSQGNGASAYAFYDKMVDGKLKRVAKKFFCHAHGDHIDCH